MLIQFGHNDSHEPGRPESTDPQTEFPANLRRYVEEARAIGATPILLTPVVRRIFGQDERLAGELQPYAEATSRVAAEMQVPLIDVPSSSRALVESLAPEGSAAMANAPGDRTHFNEPGAKAMAELVKEGAAHGAAAAAKAPVATRSRIRVMRSLSTGSDHRRAGRSLLAG